MLSKTDLKKISRSRFEESKVLFLANRYDGSVYLCGYSIEVALKSTICDFYKLSGFPETKDEFKDLREQKGIDIKIHDLDKLLRLSGMEPLIKSTYLADWSIVTQWDPKVRYRPIGSAKKVDAQNMIESAVILRGLL